MSNFEKIEKPSSISSSNDSNPPIETPDEPKVKSPNNLHLGFPFNLPATPEAAAGRIIKNLCHFGLFYMLVLWVGLSISLVPDRKFSLVLLMATTIVGNQYYMMVQLMSKSICIHKVYDKMLILVLMAIVTTVELILTEAAIHFVITLGISIPVILVHAVFWTDSQAPASAPGESAPLVDKVSSV